MADYIRIKDPKKPDDYLVLDRREYDPLRHELIGDAPPMPEALGPEHDRTPLTEPRVEYIAIQDPDKAGDYLLVAKDDFDGAKHQLYEGALPEPALEATAPGETGLVDPADRVQADGPTFEEFVEAGYPAAEYPPVGYAEKASPGLQQYRERQSWAATHVAAASAKEAIAAIKGMDDQQLLDLARQAEGGRAEPRSTVIEAIDKRLAELHG
jgi:hypothetical protein